MRFCFYFFFTLLTFSDDREKRGVSRAGDFAHVIKSLIYSLDFLVDLSLVFVVLAGEIM